MLLRMLPLFLLPCFLCGQPDRWKDLAFLIGDFAAEGGSTSTGQSAGAYTFLPELEGKVLVRRSSADYPAANGRPAIHHEDVMTVYREADGKPPEAIYFDNEGHVIHYAIQTDSAAKVIRFVSPAVPELPRYRLTYKDAGGGLVSGTFEVAAPGKPDNFNKYMAWTARRHK